MADTHGDCTTMTDSDLLAETIRLAAVARDATVALLRCLMEVEARRLHLAQGYGSLFTYCTRVLHLSEHAAYRRIEAARTARRYPCILELLAEGEITLTTIGLVAAHLTDDNHRALLQEVRHTARRDVERIVARLRPRPDVPPTIRKLPVPTVRVPALVESGTTGDRSPAIASGVPVIPAPPRPQPTSQEKGRNGMPSCLPGAPRPVVAALTPDRYKLQLTVPHETCETLRRLQDLMRHTNPTGDIAVIVDQALTLLLAQVERQKMATTTQPRRNGTAVSRTRHIPAAVKRAVWARDEGRCAFVSAEGHRCSQRAFLEFHHLVPFADGGVASADSIAVRCRAHNAYEADRWFGASWTLRDAEGPYRFDLTPSAASWHAWRRARRRPDLARGKRR
jgi:hypothetical protein